MKPGDVVIIPKYKKTNKDPIKEESGTLIFIHNKTCGVLLKTGDIWIGELYDIYLAQTISE